MRIAAYNANWDKFVLGNTREEIINQVCTFSFENKQIKAKFLHYEEVKFHNYNEEWTDDEARQDAIKFLFDRQLSNFGWKIYTEYRG